MTYYTFFGYHIKFFDFTLLGHDKNVLKQMKGINDACHFEIGKDYYDKIIEKIRFAIVILFYSDDLNKYVYDSFILCEELSPTELYISLTCSKEIYSDKKYLANNGKKDSNDNPLSPLSLGNIKTGFGVILRCIMLKYTKSIGFVNIYNDAAGYDLIPYYTRFGYRLGKSACNTSDIVTDEHEKSILDANDKEFYLKLKDSEYKTPNGFRMKLCGNKYENMCDYSYKKIKETWAELEQYDDIYISS